MKQINLDQQSADALSRELKVPIGLLNDLSMTKSTAEVLQVYAKWSNRIIAGDRCTIALAETATHLKLHAIDGNKAIPVGFLMPIAGTLIGQVFETRIPAHCPSFTGSDFIDCQKLAAAGFEACFDAPLVVGNHCFGVIAVGLLDASSFKEEDFIILQALGRCLATHLLLLEQMKSLVEIAMTDPLTGVYNRRQFIANAVPLWEGWKADQRHFALMLLDLDHFKTINDTFGHAGGDAVLKGVVARIQRHMRQDDILIRMGGEEFAVLMPDVKSTVSADLAERLLQAIRSTPINFQGAEIPVTTSIGLAIADPADSDVDALTRRADEALYAAKSSGRNRVVLAEAPSGV